jgi:hypothetical protein
LTLQLCDSQNTPGAIAVFKQCSAQEPAKVFKPGHAKEQIMVSFRRSQHHKDREKKRYRAVRLAYLALLLVLTASLMHAQQITGTIVGTVNDPQGAVISGAIVKATNTATAFSRVVTANGYGQYRIDYLPVGTYTLEVNANGFKALSATEYRFIG